MSRNNIIVKVLGTAQDAGVPHANCHCHHCLLAIKQPRLKRYPAALAIMVPQKHEWHLVDATPDIRDQIEMVRSEYPDMGLMKSVILTHAHIGHYTGLMFLGREAISSKSLPVYAGTEMTNVLRNHVPWKQLVDLHNIEIKRIASEQSFELDDHVAIMPIEVPHRNEYSETFGFIFSGMNKRLLYIPDIDQWEEWDKELQEIVSSVDYCLLDGTFYSEDELKSRGRDLKEIPHPRITHTMDFLMDIAQSQATEIYFTHFNHTNPVVNPNHQVRIEIKEKGFYIAEEGIEFHL
jgi:pyrroloquinoline quinone biosynthesis protein B